MGKIPAYRHNFGTTATRRPVLYEQMFGTVTGTIDRAFEREREADRRALVSICEQQARLAQQRTVIVRRADDRGDWQAAGCSSSAQWLAQISSSDYRTALRITETAEALRELPALDEALSTGELTLDQVAAAAPIATPESDAEIRASRSARRRARSRALRARSCRPSGG